MSRDYAAFAAGVDDRARALYKAAPKAMGAFRTLSREATRAGTLDTRTKELMALAIAIVQRCEGCVVFHTKAVLKNGASRAELLDTIAVAIEMGGGPASVYGADALAAYDQFTAG